jgi:hypothetical protein
MFNYFVLVFAVLIGSAFSGRNFRNSDSLESLPPHSALHKELSRNGWARLPNVLQNAGFDVESTARLVKQSIEEEVRSCAKCTDIQSLDESNHMCFGCDASMRQSEEDNIPRAFLRARRLRGLDQIVRSRELGKIVANAMNATKIRLYQASAFIKRSGDAPSVYHQDAQAAPFDSDKLVTLWLALSDIKKDCGLLKFVNGSHHSGIKGSLKDVRPISGRLLKSKIFDMNDDEIAKVTRCSIALPPEEGMKAGGASLHLGWTLHGADSNSCEEERIGLAIMYFVSGARIDNDLVLIEDEHGNDYSGQVAQHYDGDENAVKLQLFRHTLYVRLLADDSVTWLRWLKRKPMPLLINGAEVNDDILTPIVYDALDDLKSEL